MPFGIAEWIASIDLAITIAKTIGKKVIAALESANKKDATQLKKFGALLDDAAAQLSAMSTDFRNKKTPFVTGRKFANLIPLINDAIAPQRYVNPPLQPAKAKEFINRLEKTDTTAKNLDYGHSMKPDERESLIRAVERLAADLGAIAARIKYVHPV